MNKIIVSEKCLEVIKHFEGFSSKIYICPGGYKTIGYGHKIERHEKFTVITLDEGHALLMQDIVRIENSLRRNIIVPLTQGQLDALISFIFNVGAGAFQRSTLRQKINRYEFDCAQEELLKWIHIGGKKSRGLLLRRQAEIELFYS